MLESRGRQLIKIDTTRNAFTDGITTIPIRSTTPTVVKACGLETERKRANQSTGCIINGYGYGSIFRELIGNPRLRVKRIRVVLQQQILRRSTDTVKPEGQNRRLPSASGVTLKLRVCDSTLPSGPMTRTSTTSPT